MSPEETPLALDHPLPAGMRDLLPEEAAARRDLARSILERFALNGYALVTSPVFEFAEVLERGLGTLDPADVLRFVEPESGEVAALRPDMTPQIARMIATRLRDRPPPYRLGYEGTVVRRLSGRARKQRQIPQVGVELAGVASQAGDLELLTLAVDALRAVGLQRFVIDLGDAGVVRSLVTEPLDAKQRATLTAAVARKDDAQIADLCAAYRVPFADALQALPQLYGGREALVEGVARLEDTPAGIPAARLLALFDAASAAGLGPHLLGDLGEVRGFAYYTGAVFHAYAPGTGDALASGGRYDELLARFGMDLPAAGFGIDLDRAREALRAAQVALLGKPRVVVVGRASEPRLAELRGRGIAAVAVDDRGAALEWARAWGFTHVVDAGAWVDPATGAASSPPGAGVGDDTGERGRR